ncbi:MAG: VWA domain-containing protein [Pseudomonadales bacterium]
MRLLLTTLWLLLVATQALASAARPAEPAALDVRLVVDVSGSMAKSDPDGMLAPALQLFLELLPTDSRAGVWTFAQQVNALVKHEPVTPLWRTQALAKTARLPAVGLRTALGAAIDQAAWDWQSAAPGTIRHLILLTDGEVDLADSSAVNVAARNQLLRTRLPQLAAAGYRIHTLALSDQGDLAFLKEAALLSQGQFLAPESPATLPEELVQLFSAIGPADRIPALAVPTVPAAAVANAGAPGAAATTAFQVEPGIDEVTVFITKNGRQALSLLAPDGVRYDRARVPASARWHVSDRYELLTLSAPVAGSWELSGGAAAVFGYGSLQLRLLDRPRRIAPGSAQSLRLTLESGDPNLALSREFLQLVTFSASIESDQGQPLALVEQGAQGQLQVLLSRLQGVEQGLLTVQAKGPTFERMAQLPFAVAHPLRAELHPAVPDGLGSAVGATLWITLNQPGLAPGSARIAAGVQQSPAPQRWYPLTAQPAGMWRAELPSELEGSAELVLDVHANYLNGGDFNYRTQALAVAFPITAAERFSFADSGRQDRPPPSSAAAEVGPPKSPSPVAQAAVIEPQTDSSEPPAMPALSAAEALAAQQEAALEPAMEPAQVPIWFAGVGMLLPLLLLGGLGWGLSRMAIKRVDSLDQATPEVA